MLVTLKNTAELAYKYEWDLGDGDRVSIDKLDHVYENTSSETQYFVITQKAISVHNCFNTISKTVSVYPTPFADFEPDKVISKFPASEIGKATITFADITQPYGNWNYSWNFGDGSTSNIKGSTSHAYKSWNNGDSWYTVTLKTESNKNCTSQASHDIRITAPDPEANLTISPTSGCPPFLVVMTNTSQYDTSVVWTIKEADDVEKEFTGDFLQYTFTKSGKHSILMTIEGEGGKTSVDTNIHVFIEPTTRFDYSPKKTSISTPELSLLNTSIPIDSILFCEWEIYNDKGSYLYLEGCEHDNVEVDRTMAGTNNIKLITTTYAGCSDTLVVENALEIETLCNIRFPDAFSPIISNSETDGKVLFAETEEASLYYRNSNYHNDLFFAQICESGVIDYYLEIYNNWGEKIYASANKDEGWNGYYRGEPCNTGVYLYKFTGTCENGTSIEKKGDITLFR